MKKLIENALLVEVVDEVKDSFRNVELRFVPLNSRFPEIVQVRVKPELIDTFRPLTLQVFPEVVVFENKREGVSAKTGKPYSFINYNLDRLTSPSVARKAA